MEQRAQAGAAAMLMPAAAARRCNQNRCLLIYIQPFTLPRKPDQKYEETFFPQYGRKSESEYPRLTALFLKQSTTKAQAPFLVWGVASTDQCFQELLRILLEQRKG